ncbi:desulfoferrodoxin [Candidatus Woesearchaeota archaeon]|nr:MAG: desulfoferrodoxin [Candidatus Woesearchaeota archaeon]
MKQGDVLKGSAGVFSVVTASGSVPEGLTALPERTAEQEGKEKHVPVLEIDGNNVVVKVGSVPHPMEEDHYIELIQLLQGDKVIAERRLFPGDEPKAVFFVEDTTNLRAREHCNLHGLWTT